MRKRFFWQAAVGLLIGIATMTSIVWGATYNFYFTNTEPGHDSTATPSVTVTDGKAVTTGASPGPSPMGNAAAAAAPAPAPTPAVTAEPVVAAAEEVHETQEQTRARWRLNSSDPLRHWELGLGAQARSTYGMSSVGPGAELDLGYHFTHDLGLEAFIGYNVGTISGWDQLHGGLEFQLIPVHISIGRFTDFIDLGVLAGLSTIAAAPGNYVTVHGGARLDLNFGDRWGLTATGRLNAGYYMVSSGVTIHI
ncbi:MAG: hypothetical protein ACXWPM_09840 [Bdellovibrionota bacterium]